MDFSIPPTDVGLPLPEGVGGGYGGLGPQSSTTQWCQEHGGGGGGFRGRVSPHLGKFVKHDETEDGKRGNMDFSLLINLWKGDDLWMGG